MKPGVRVTYQAGDGAVVLASVVAVVGTGGSGFKIVDLYANGEVISSVPHAGDAHAGEGWWTLDPMPAPDAPIDADLAVPAWQAEFATESPDV